MLASLKLFLIMALKLKVNHIYLGDSKEVLKTFPGESINCVVTSPPYWSLRDYGVNGQLGLEKTFNDYINKLCDVFDEVKRVLRKNGTCWVNLGDTYSGSGGTSQKFNDLCLEKRKIMAKVFPKKEDKPSWSKLNYTRKSLVMIPFRFAIEMVNRGWILRNVIIWHKPNCMPSSVKDRLTVDFEYLFFFTKEKNYFFETQYEESVTKSYRKFNIRVRNVKSGKISSSQYKASEKELSSTQTKLVCSGKRNKRCVWHICTKGFHGEHFAVYPEKLIETPIRAGCKEKGIILDPFFGAGTTGIVALKQNKKYVGIELNPKYKKLAEKRLKQISI